MFLTDIKTPYTVAVLNALAHEVDLSVLFCAETASRGLGWSFDQPLEFRHRTVGGLTVARGTPDDTDYHLSPRILRALWRERPDAIIVSGYSAPAAYAALTGMVRGCPILLQSDGTEDSEARLNALQRIGRQVLVPAASAAVANSRPSAARFAQLGMPPERIFQAPHSTAMEPLWQVARERQPHDDRRLRLLAAGRLIPRKGFDRLLRAVRLARDAGAEVTLEIVGTGPEEVRLRTLAAELGLADVRWPGFVEQDRLPGLFAGAEAFAFPSLSDPFGLVLLEAAAAGLALIGSPRAGATLDLVQEGHTGFVRDPQDAPGWAEAIGRLAADPQLRASMGRAAHLATLGRTPEAAAAGYRDAVEFALSRPRQPRRGAVR